MTKYECMKMPIIWKRYFIADEIIVVDKISEDVKYMEKVTVRITGC